MEIESRVPAINMEAAQKVIRQQLVLLLHAHSCQQKDVADDGDSECTLPYCKKTKEVLNHIRNCVQGTDCDWDHCIAYQQIIAHWKHCSQKKRCSICGPIFTSQINNALNASCPKSS
ncbi:hypothetical protein Ocin01_01573 [Orchesella cincta]|uniref:histone acetyltransferase n=1 Tax=Orchesella cincta TaxID=48709 RepID=A0A1D2NIL7_ORCCI|nr:hypothetical protein Ocin01_01573 [Orchesella cincta]